MSEQYDFTEFDTSDVAQIGLQRTQHLRKFPLLGCPSYKAWQKGDWKPLLREAKERRSPILHNTMADIASEFAVIEEHLQDHEINQIMDIGCGHALIDLLFWRRYNCSIHLVDIEESESAYHDYHEKGSGYASLDAARRFLTSNGVPVHKLTLTNPIYDILRGQDLDMIISMISAGFHYPISTYTQFALNALRPGGVLVFDARVNTNQEMMLAGFESVEVVAIGSKHKRLAAYKPA